MTSHYYAQISDQSICFSVSQLSGEIIAADMIPISSYDTSLLGKVWTGTEWEDPTPEPEPDPAP